MYQAFQSGQIILLSKITLHDVFVFLIFCEIINLYLSCGSFFFLMLISLPGQEGLNLLQATFHGKSPLWEKNTKPISFLFMQFKNCGSLK